MTPQFYVVINPDRWRIVAYGRKETYTYDRLQQALPARLLVDCAKSLFDKLKTRTHVDYQLKNNVAVEA